MPSKILILFLLFLLQASCLLRDNGSLPELLILRELGKKVDSGNINIVTPTVTNYTIGGTVTQLASGRTFVIQNNGVDDLTISANGSYTFKTSIADKTAYAVSILTQPINQICVLANDSGTLAGANITNVDITCTKGELLSGTVVNPLTLTGGVTTLNGSPCAAETSGCSIVTGYADSTSPDSVKYNGGQGLTTDGLNLYVADQYNHRIRKVVIATGVTTTLAGSGIQGFLDGTGTSAKLDNPRYITTDGTYIYLSDSSNDSVRRIDITTGVVKTIVTNSSLLNDPRGLVVYNNILYVLNNNSDRLRQIDLSTNTVSTITTTGVSFSTPRNMTILGTDLYIADSGADEILKTTIGSWVLTSFVGSSAGYFDSVTGNLAKFKDLEGMTTDGSSLYIADTGNHNIRKITVPGGVVTTLAGQTLASASNSGYTNSSTYTTARFKSPKGITSDGLNLYIFDTGNNAIRKIQ
ncbi:MAG: hypothetical protein IPO06_02135 [Leptospiraceae bacterium]|nr:hypothetical protein [Leptospiraceae bacterium]MBP9889879.1 hypothetical protein [Leptospiraceae bacterium]